MTASALHFRSVQTGQRPVLPVMMIRRWYRSRLFWLGIPGLVFLFWMELEFLGRVVDISVAVPRSYIFLVIAGDRDIGAQFIDVSPIKHQNSRVT